MPGKSIDLSIKDPEDEAPAVGDLQSEESAAQKLAEMVAAPAALPEPEVVDFKEGDKVSARWNGGAWFLGIVKKVNTPVAEEAKEAPDGGEMASVEMSEPAEAKEGGEIAVVETAVEPQREVEPQVSAKTYAVQYDDGDFDAEVPQDHIKLWEEKRSRKRRIVPQVLKAVDDLKLSPDAAPIADTNALDSSAKNAVQADAGGLSAPESQSQNKEPAAEAMVQTAAKDESEIVVDVAAASSSSEAQAAPKKRRIIPTTVTPAP